MMSICSWEHPRTLSSLPVMAYEECGFEDNSKQSRWQTTPRTAVTAENRSNAILASFSLFSFSMLPVIILRILVFQCEDRHIFLHLQRLGATTVRQNCTKNGLQVSVDHCCAERARFRRPGAVAISVPSRGVLARQWNGSCGRRPLVCFRFRPLTKASFRRARNQKQPVAFATSCRSIALRRERDMNPKYSLLRVSYKSAY